MTDHPQQLNPPQTPICNEYIRLRVIWLHQSHKEQSWIKAHQNMTRHRASCPVCQARKAEFDELARNAKEPEVKDERQTD